MNYISPLNGVFMTEPNFQRAYNSMMSNGQCLVARATDSLCNRFDQLQLDKAKAGEHRQTPAEFRQMQAVRSSALAHKTKTASKFGGSIGGSDLIAVLQSKSSAQSEPETTVKPTAVAAVAAAPVSPVKHKKSIEMNNTVDSGKGDELSDECDEQPEPSGLCDQLHKLNIDKDEDKPKPELLDRGPCRGGRTTYKQSPYPMTSQANVPDNTYNAHAGYDYQNEYYWQPPSVDSPGTAQTSSSGLGYGHPAQPLSTDDLSRLLQSGEAPQQPAELPDELSDFILKYSRRYSSSRDDAQTPTLQQLKRKTSDADSDTASDTTTHITSSPSHRPFSQDGLSDSGIDSPMSVTSAHGVSPAAPKGAHTPTTPTKQVQSALVPQGSQARDKLKAMVSVRELDEAWAWTCKCTQAFPGAIYYCDRDGDTLVHITAWHKDLAKVYALVEQMIKNENTLPPDQPRPRVRPFDLPNKSHETPLFLAVEKRCVEIVSYLLEVGANPNFSNRRPERDSPIHYAASRGMTEIVEALCANKRTDVDARNGMGQTALLCAVRNHGVIEEGNQCLVNNQPTIRALLSAHASPMLADITNGKTVLHYAVERMDPDLVEIFRVNLDADTMRALCNQPDASRETPLQLLEAHSLHTLAPGHQFDRSNRLAAEEQLRKSMLHALVQAGAQPTQY